MSRYLLFVLLLGGAVALAQDTPKTEQANGVGAAEKKTEAAPSATDHAHAKKEPAHRQAEQAHAKTETAHTKTEPTHTKTEPAHAKTEPAKQGTDEPQSKKEEAQGQSETTEAKPEGAKLTSVPDAKALGMSILGNQDAPKSLVIVPWKTSELGDSPGVSPMLDDSRQPVDKEVFMRSMRYYEIRSKTKP